MFNTNLPSERHKVLVIVIFLLLVVLLVYFSVENQGNIQSTFKHDNNSSAEVTFSHEDVSTAQNISHDFMSLFFQVKKDPKKLKMIKKIVTDSLYKNIVLDTESVKVKSPYALLKIDKTSISQENKKLKALLQVQLKDGNNKLEQTYELILIKRDNVWLIEEVIMHGTFD